VKRRTKEAQTSCFFAAACSVGSVCMVCAGRNQVQGLVKEPRCYGLSLSQVVSNTALKGAHVRGRRREESTLPVSVPTKRHARDAATINFFSGLIICAFMCPLFYIFFPFPAAKSFSILCGFREADWTVAEVQPPIQHCVEPLLFVDHLLRAMPRLSSHWHV